MEIITNQPAGTLRALRDVETTEVLVALREVTRVAHQSAEQNAFMRALREESLSWAMLKKVTAGYGVVYEAMEGTIRAAQFDCPWLSRLSFDGIFRCEALAEDVAQMQIGPTDVSETALEYARHLSSLRGAPKRVIAHVYARYLGDLSGGQMLAAQLQRLFSREPRLSLRFYDFGDADAVATKKQRLRQELTSLLCDADEAMMLEEEAKYAFSVARRMLDDPTRVNESVKGLA